MKKLVIILDPAHGIEVPGKRSPDGKHREYRWSREVLKNLEHKLQDNGYRVEYTTLTDTEPGLTFRKNIASTLKIDNGQTKFLLSLHNNAAGIGTEWMSARGVEIFTTIGQTKSDVYADIILTQLQSDFPNFKFRMDLLDGDKDKESNFTVLTGNGYSAILLEWLFQDNKEDVELLMNKDTNNKLVESLFKSIEQINNTL